MPRPPTIDDKALLERLSGVFRDVGYDGASLALLSDATGLQKASLYHRFPGGKEQMAKEVLLDARSWLTENILLPLAADGPAQESIQTMIKSINRFYAGGKQACLLNMLSSPHIHQGPFSNLIKEIFGAWISALADVVATTGFDKKEARMRAERAIALLHGSLVMARGMGTTKPFRDMLGRLPAELLGDGAPTR